MVSLPGVAAFTRWAMVTGVSSVTAICHPPLCQLQFLPWQGCIFKVFRVAFGTPCVWFDLEATSCLHKKRSPGSCPHPRVPKTRFRTTTGSCCGRTFSIPQKCGAVCAAALCFCMCAREPPLLKRYGTPIVVFPRHFCIAVISTRDLPQVISLEVAGVTDVSLVGSFGFTLTVINKKCACTHFWFWCSCEKALLMCCSGISSCVSQSFSSRPGSTPLRSPRFVLQQRVAL